MDTDDELRADAVAESIARHYPDGFDIETAAAFMAAIGIIPPTTETLVADADTDDEGQA